MPQDSLVSIQDTAIVSYTGSYDSTPIIDQDTTYSVVADQSQNDFLKKSEDYSQWAIPITIALFAGTWFLLKFLNKNPFHLKLDDDPSTSSNPDDTQTSTDAEPQYDPVLVYEGRDLGLSEEDITSILVKRFSYFNALGEADQERFLLRHKKFMTARTFNIHDVSGFREMPVLISAAAIQLSFGLQEFMLEAYPYINIFPQEFVRADSNGICFLEGNVSGNCINISWKHFLNGFRMPDDGDNVGLHEMAHAYYCQNMECGSDTDHCFVQGWPAFNTAGNKAFEAEKTAAVPFYSTYAQRNFQEFWAESIERFFERGGEMKNTYPDVYRAISVMLNQATMS